MPGQKKKTNPALLLITIILCLVLGILLTQSSADPLAIDDSTAPDMYVAESQEDNTASEDEAVSEGSDSSEEESPDPTPEPTATPIPTPTIDASPQAANGVWTASGSNWMFLVDGVPYTGWLTDVDGKRYYFNGDGIMQIGWLDDDGKRYYLNLDGIMQTGDVTVDGQTYHLLDDGSLEGYSADVPSKEKSNEDASSQASADKTDTSQSTEEPAQEEQTKEPDKTVALTFDDGPSSFTGRLLDCLEANNAKATFFMVGKEIEYFQDEVLRMEALGCELGNHTYSHADLSTLSAEDISAEIAATDNLLLNLTGHGATVVRPPYGSVNDTVRSTVGTPMILWSIDTLDWKTQDAQQTVDTVLSQVQDGDIILMHDIYSETVDAAEILIPALIKEGYKLVTMHELAEAHGVTLETGILYGSMYE